MVPKIILTLIVSLVSVCALIWWANRNPETFILYLVYVLAVNALLACSFYL